MMILLLFFIFGLIFGSFLSVLTTRLKSKKKGILLGRSACPHCQHNLQAKDLFPLFSFLFQGGKCRYCRTKIPFFYPLIELTTGILFLGIGYFFYIEQNVNILNLSLLFFYSLVLIIIFYYDLLYLEIPDEILLPSIVIALSVSLIPQSIFPHFLDALSGALIPVLFFTLQIIISQGKWIGGGDLRIGAFMGAILGWKMTILALILSYFIGALVSIPILLSKNKSLKSEVPFGPFLVSGTLVALFFGDKILSWYFSKIFINLTLNFL